MLIDAVTVPEGRRGKWSVQRFTVEPNALETLRLGSRAPFPGTYTRLSCDGRGVVMSDTTAERRDHYDFVRMATGHCLINGLGLGMCLAAALKKPDVERVTVVELDRDVIDLVGPHYEGPRVEIVHSSAFDYEPPKGARYGAVWHDIWDTICTNNLPEMQKLHRKYGRRADWQGSWARYLCERQREADRADEMRARAFKAMVQSTTLRLAVS